MPSHLRAEAAAAIVDQNVEFIHLWFTDVLGFLKTFVITVDELETAMTEGMGFDGSSIQGFARIQESDMVALPDPTTLQILPWRQDGQPVATMFCDIVRPDGSPYEGDPRYVLKRNLKRAADKGYTFFVGPELEYYYLKNDVFPEVVDHGTYFDQTTRDLVGGPAQSDGSHAQGLRHPGRVQPPRGRPEPARDRPALQRGAQDGRRRHDLPARRQGGRADQRPVRDVHAQADVRRGRKRHARAPVPVHGRLQRLLRPRRRVPPLGSRQELHGRPAATTRGPSAP